MATVFKNASNCPTGYALNSTISCETDGAKVTLALAVTPPATAPTDPLNYKMDTGDFGTSNSFTAVPFGAHTFVLRIGGPDQASCYYAKTNVAADFNNCSALPCDNIYLLAKDQTGTETTIIPRETGRHSAGTNALKNLTLSAATFDDSPLLGVTYAWTGPNGFTATTASIQAGMIGTYKLTLTRGTSTCSQEIALSAMPCAALPATGVNCSNEHLTGIADDPTNRLTALNVGDVVQAGDFEVTIIEATGNKDGWTGKGYVKVPYLQAEVSIVLTSAVFNSCYQLTNANITTALPATVYTEYDKDGWENNMYSIDFAFKGVDAIKQDLIDLFTNFKDTPEYKETIRLKIVELENLINAASAKQLDPDVKAELQASIDAIKNPCIPCIQGATGGRLDASSNVQGCDVVGVLNFLKGSATPQQLVLKCLGGATTDILFSYFGKWLELALDNNASNNKNFTDFSGITSQMNWSEVTASAAWSCLQSVLPFGSSKSKLIIASGIAADATVSFMTNLMGQYDDYNRAHPNGTVKGYFEQIQWRPPIIAAGTSALAGVVIEICKTPKFAAIARLMRMTLKSASGYSTLRRRFLAIGCDDATWGKIVKFLGGACFPAKTPIYTIHGLKPIEAITVKDTVYSYDEAAQKYTLNKVKQTFKKTATKLVMLYALGGKLIASPTPEHPFFVKNTYKPAKELVKGDSLLSKNQGYVVIEKTVVVDSVLNVYNFEVENDHNYLVGEDEILVHNTCWGGEFFYQGIGMQKAIDHIYDLHSFINRTSVKSYFSGEFNTKGKIKDLVEDALAKAPDSGVLRLADGKRIFTIEMPDFIGYVYSRANKTQRKTKTMTVIIDEATGNVNNAFPGTL